MGWLEAFSERGSVLRDSGLYLMRSLYVLRGDRGKPHSGSPPAGWGKKRHTACLGYIRVAANPAGDIFGPSCRLWPRDFNHSF